MPDFFDNRAGDAAPSGWGEVFAALPTETPPKDGWTRLNRALDARSPRMRTVRRERRTSWLIGIASAAVLVLVTWSPLSRWLQAESTKVQPPAMAATTPGLRGPAAPVRAEPDVTMVTDDVGTEPNAISAASARGEPVLRKPARKARVIAKRTDLNAPATPAISHAAPEHSATEAATNMEASSPPTAEALQKLQTQSAQLEALVTLARDDRVGNAGSALLSSELDAGIAAIDATLSQPDLGDARQQELWQQRVDLLQQLAGMEATSRWLAAQGTANDTTLVSVD